MEQESTRRGVLVYIHIPKTGGKSLLTAIRKNYPPEVRVPIYRTGNTDLSDFFSKLAPEVRDRASIVLGHIPHVVDRFMGRPCEYFTFLRDPVDRILSFYKYIKYDFEKHPLHKAFKEGRIDFDRFIEGDLFVNQANCMTKLLSGREVTEEVTATDCRIAQANLERMRAFGLTEDYNRSIALVGAAFDWQDVQYEYSNRSSLGNEEFIRREGIRDAALEHIERHNQLDRELYEYAREAYSRRLEAYGL